MQIDDMVQQVDDMDQQIDDMSQLVDDMGGQQVEYLVVQSFLWSSACEGLPDQLTVTALGLCLNECAGCGSMKYEVSSGASGAGSVEVVRYGYTDDACRVGRSRQSSEQQLLGCGVVSGGSSGVQNVSMAASFPSMAGASYYVSR
jgi:hypothetical protein